VTRRRHPVFRLSAARNGRISTATPSPFGVSFGRIVSNVNQKLVKIWMLATMRIAQLTLFLINYKFACGHGMGRMRVLHRPARGQPTLDKTATRALSRRKPGSTDPLAERSKGGPRLAGEAFYRIGSLNHLVSCDGHREHGVKSRLFPG
jgi:hypothetical protein